MTRVRGVSLRQSGAWSVLPAQPRAKATGSMHANALPHAPHVPFSRWFRSIRSGRGRLASSRARYNLHSEGVRHLARGSSNQVLKRPAARSGVALCVGPAAA